MTSLKSTHSLAWSLWRNMSSLSRRELRLSKTMPNNWGRPPSACRAALQASDSWVCSVVFIWAHVIRLFMKCLWGLVTTLGQNQTCLRNTGLILQLQCSRLSLPCLPDPHCSPSQMAGPHLLCCWVVTESRGSGSRLAHDRQEVVRNRERRKKRRKLTMLVFIVGYFSSIAEWPDV